MQVQLNCSDPVSRNAKLLRLLSLTIFLSVVSAAFGKPLYDGGKIALSNLVQIVFCLVLFSYRPRLTLGQGAVLAVMIITTIMSSAYTFFNFSFFGKPIILIFMLISLVYVFSFCNIAKIANIGIWDIARPIRLAIYACALIYPLFFVQEVLQADGVSLGMDDKSHSSIYLGFLAFLSIRFVRKGKLLFCLYFFFISLLSISRLAFVFAPFLLLMILMHLFSESSSGGKVKAFLLIGILAAAGASLIVEHPEYFQVFERVSSAEAIAESDSSLAHKLLLDKGIELKFSDLGLLILGTSPGSFADILVRSTVSYSELRALDPKFIEFAWEGRAPIHSTHMAFFVEYSIFVFAIYAGYMAWLAWRLVRRRDITLALFMIPFCLSTLFYSSHNKFYFFVIFVVVEMILRSPKTDPAILCRRDTLRCSNALAAA